MKRACIHGIDRRFPCGLCRTDREIVQQVQMGKLRTLPYREALADFLGVPIEGDPPPKHRCEACKKRQPIKGNRLYVRLPRLRESFAVGPKPIPPTWDGPVAEMPKVNWASHRRNGHWFCDRCDPHYAVGEAPAVFELANL